MTTIKLKNGSGAPLAGDLVQGEPALDLTNKRLYTEDSGGTVIEVGTNPGTDVTIEEFANLVKETVGYEGALAFDHTRPDGTPRKVMDVSRLAKAGWTSRIALPAGLADAYDWFVRNVA